MIDSLLPLLLLYYGTAYFSGCFVCFEPLRGLLLWLVINALLLTLYKLFLKKASKRGYFNKAVKISGKAELLAAVSVVLLFVFTKPSELFAVKASNWAEFTDITLSLILYSILIYAVYSIDYAFRRRFFPLTPDNKAVFFREKASGLIIGLPLIILWQLFDSVTASNSGFYGEICSILLSPLFFAAVLIFVPKLLNMAWQTEDLDNGKLVSDLKDLAEKAKAPVRGVKVCKAFGEGVANAAVSGGHRKLRYIYLSSSLIKLLTDEELKAVIAHELGHIRLKHLQSYLFYSVCLTFFSLLLKIYLYINFYGDYMETLAFSLTTGIIFLIVFILSFSYLSRQAERKADEFAFIITDGKDFASALNKISSDYHYNWKYPPWIHLHPLTQDRKKAGNNYENKEGALKKLEYKSYFVFCSFIFFSLISGLLLFHPIKDIKAFSDCLKHVENCDLEAFKTRFASLPPKLQKHKVLYKEILKTSLKENRASAALAAMLELELKPEVFSASEILHHACSPVVAFDFKVMQLALDLFNFGGIHGVPLLNEFLNHIEAPLRQL
ncbi:MAG: M48 family metalloprotease [Candidatus Riflebacteria bacterium]|nr:M48 family metalloprotease [Candidatus Riflebacteria bacterium]